MSEPTCETCKFWYRLDDEEGMCRRYPPFTVRTDPNIGMDAFTFPATSMSEWCGEHQPKPNLE